MAVTYPPTKPDTTLPGEPGAHALPVGPGLSVVIPIHNEAENLQPLIEEIYAALTGRIVFECICVDDGSTDGTLDALRAAKRLHPDLRVIRHRSRCGQSTAVRTGVKLSRASWVVTLDADGQNDPADIPRLLAVIGDPGHPPDLQLVNGLRQKRRDNWVKRISSRIANRVRASILRDDTPDSGCGLKLFRRDAYLDLPYYDHMHRFIPALVQRGGGRVISVPVGHRPRAKGRSHYGTLDRLGAGIVDLLGTVWLQRRSHRPIADEWEGDG